MLNSTIQIKNPSFSEKYFRTKSPQAKSPRAGNCQAPPIGHVQNF